MKLHSYGCDHCSNLKGESNHWWLRAPDSDKFTLQRWDEAQAAEPGVRRKLFLWVDENYFSCSATTTTVSSVGQGRSPAAVRFCLKR